MLDLRSRSRPRDLEPDCGRWEVDDPRGDAVIECRWSGGEVDWATRLETQTSTFTVRGGPEEVAVDPSMPLLEYTDASSGLNSSMSIPAAMKAIA